MQGSPQPLRAKGMLSKTLSGETVILEEESWKCFLLNRTASYIWQLSGQKKSVQAIISFVAKKYGISKACAAKDVKRLLAYLRKAGLIYFVNKKAKK
jgi:hypothetical protein